MELNWSTFVLEIINFLILVWILKHFLYRPVLAVIERRRAGIDQALQEAHDLHADARALQSRYEGRLADWEQERQQARAALDRELEEERNLRLAALQENLAQAREQSQVAEQRRAAETRRRLEERVLEQGAQFATRLLEQAAGPELEARLVDLASSELERLAAQHTPVLSDDHGQTEAVVVSSAYPLGDARRQRLEQALAAAGAGQRPLRFAQDTALLAGVQIACGAQVLAANLRDELQGFADLARHG